MKRTFAFIFAVVLIVGCGVGCGAQEDRGYWRAESTTAKSITGDIAFANTKVTINFLTFPLAEIRRLKPAEVSAVFDADVNAGIEGTLYRLNVAPGQRFLHKNTLCGSDPTQWMVTYVTGRTLQVALFSGEDMPVFTFDAISKTTTLCGTFSYGR